MDRHFDAGAYSLKLLFHDEQRRIVRRILETRMALAEASYRQIYKSDSMLMYFVKSLGMPLPNRFRMAADFVFNTDLRRALEFGPSIWSESPAMVDETRRLGVELDAPPSNSGYAARSKRSPRSSRATPPRATDGGVCGRGDVGRSLPFEVRLWNAQNIWYDLLLSLYPEMREQTAWSDAFRALGRQLQLPICQCKRRTPASRLCVPPRMPVRTVTFPRTMPAPGRPWAQQSCHGAIR